MRLERMTWVQAENYFKDHDTAMIVTGATECHGRHAALGTDTLVPNRLAEMIEERSDILILPAIPYGNSDWFTDFPGTVSIGAEILRDLLIRVCMCVRRYGIRKFIFLNGHGGNTATLNRVANALEKEGALCATINWWLLAGELNPAWKGGHGGGEETAALLAISPDLVDRSEIADAHVAGLSEGLPAVGMNTVAYRGISVNVPRQNRTVCENGWYGPDHPSTATEEWGKEMLQAVTDYVLGFIGEFRKVPC